MRTAGLVTMLVGGLMFANLGIDFAFDLASSSRDMFNSYTFRSIVFAAFMTCVGAYLCFWGEWIISRAFPPGPKCCPSCGYQVRGNETGICSECGAVLPPEFRVTNHE
jgi:hypothetical protein